MAENMAFIFFAVKTAKERILGLGTLCHLVEGCLVVVSSSPGFVYEW